MANLAANQPVTPESQWAVGSGMFLGSPHTSPIEPMWVGVGDDSWPANKDTPACHSSPRGGQRVGKSTGFGQALPSANGPGLSSETTYVYPKSNGAWEHFLKTRLKTKGAFIIKGRARTLTGSGSCRSLLEGAQWPIDGPGQGSTGLEVLRHRKSSNHKVGRHGIFQSRPAHTSCYGCRRAGRREEKLPLFRAPAC